MCVGQMNCIYCQRRIVCSCREELKSENKVAPGPDVDNKMLGKIICCFSIEGESGRLLPLQGTQQSWIEIAAMTG